MLVDVLLKCAEHHEFCAREPINSLQSLARSLTEKNDFERMKLTLRNEHLDYAKAIRKVIDKLHLSTLSAESEEA